MDRRVQLRELYGLEFPDELFELWAWYQGLPAEMKATFVEHGGMRPHGVCDVLDGKFDGVELRYPAVLHWRYRLDPPELVTVLTGDTDGLHWGFWFDDPKEPPVIVGNYVRDAYEFWVAGTTLFGMVADQIEKSIEGCEENLEHDAKYADEYRRNIAALKTLAKLLPRSNVKREKRTATRMTDDGMGINAFRNKLVAFPPVLAELPALVELQLGQNKIASVGDVIRGCRALEQLELADNPITALSEAIGELPALRSLNLASTKLVSLPESLGRCSSLRFLALTSTKLAALPADLSGWRDLQRVAVTKTSLPASEIERLRAAAPSAQIVT